MKEALVSFKNSKWFPLAMSVLSVVLGIILILNPQLNMESVALYAGVMFLIYGIFQVCCGILMKGSTMFRVCAVILGACMIILAIVVFANLALIGKYLPTLAGFFMIISAISYLLPSFALLKDGIKTWWFGALPAIILLVFGLVFLLLPGFVGQAFGIFTGIAMLINGASGLISFFQMRKE